MKTKSLFFRNASKGIVGDFTLQFKKVKPWPAWNLSLVIAAFPGTFPNVVYLHKFPEIDPPSNPVYNCTAFEVEWFDKIKNVGDIFDEEDAFAVKGNLTCNNKYCITLSVIIHKINKI